MKVRVEGRRRLCKISKNIEEDAPGAEEVTSTDETNVEDLWDFESPQQAKKTCASSGNEIRDILNDLSSRLEILSIEKRRIPKKVDIVDDFQDSLESKLHDVTIEEELHDYKAATSSHLPYTYSLDETTEPKRGGNFTSKYQKKKTYGDEAVLDTYNLKPSREREMNKYEMLRNNEPEKVHTKAGPTKKFQDYSNRKQDVCYTARNERPSKKVGGQSKFIEVSDEESDDITTSGNYVEEFTLSGQKGTYKLPGKIEKMLYPHQREGLKWLWSLHCNGKGGILGDDMGLGKTMQVENAYVNVSFAFLRSILFLIYQNWYISFQICSFLCGLFHSNLIRRVLVVAPKTLLTHWINELSTVGLSGKTREYDIYSEPLS